MPEQYMLSTLCLLCPSGLEENLQGQEYGISAMQGAELNLPADGLGRHHYGYTPR